VIDVITVLVPIENSDPENNSHNCDKSFHSNHSHNPFYKQTKKGHNQSCKDIENHETNWGFKFPFSSNHGYVHGRSKEKIEKAYQESLHLWVVWNSWKLIYCSDKPTINTEKHWCDYEDTVQRRFRFLGDRKIILFSGGSGGLRLTSKSVDPLGDKGDFRALLVQIWKVWAKRLKLQLRKVGTTYCTSFEIIQNRVPIQKYKTSYHIHGQIV